MRHRPTTPRRMFSGLLALAFAAAVAVLAAAAPAMAHGTLAMSTPAEGSTVSQPVTAVQLYFTEKVVATAYFTITAPGGGRVDNGWTYGSARPLDKPVREYFLVEGKFEPREYTTGFPAIVSVAHLPAAGQYSISYLSVASDGDPVRGALTFRYGGRPTPAPQGWRPPTNQPDPTLVAAAERRGTSGRAPDSVAASAAPVDASLPPAAAPPAMSRDEDNSGRTAWIGGVVAVAAAIAGLLLWRSARGAGARTVHSWRSRLIPARGALPTEPPRGHSDRGGSGPGRSARARDTRATRSGVGNGAGPRGKGAVKGNKRAAVPAARKSGPEVTAQTPVESVGNATALTPGQADAAVAAVRPPPDGAGLSNIRLALLIGGLVVALLAGFGLGRLGAGDGRSAPATPTARAGGAALPGGAPPAMDGHQHAPGTGPHTHPGDAGAALAIGTTVSAGGYTFQPVQRTQPAGANVDYRFRIVGTDRQAATRFAVVHDKPLHLIVVGRDLSGYQHLHPTMAPDGTWGIPLKLVRPGGYRIYADFTVTGPDGTQVPLVLGVDHLVPGVQTLAALPLPAPQATAGPFAVSMEGTPTVGVTTPMFFRLSGSGRDGSAPLERYLGAYGHLVVLREGDLGYVHVHPDPELVDGAVRFWLTAPSVGRYRAFFDFQVGGKVHTAEYTIDLP